MSDAQETQVDETGAQRAADVATEVVEDAATTASPETKGQLGLGDLDTGYVVGVKDGNYVFEIVGKKKDLNLLLGVNRFANAKVDQTFDNLQVSGDALVNELGKALQVMNQKLDMLVQQVKKPDTQL